MTAPSSSPIRFLRAPWILLTGVFIAFLLACSAWSLGTPISGGPDEVAHITKAGASARGMWTGTPSGSSGIEHFVLPADISDVGGDKTCFAFHPELSAACAPSLADASSTEIVVESGVGSYNPLYYVLVGWPTLFVSGELAVYAMRFVSAVLTAGCLTLAFWATRRITRSPYALGGLLVAMTPMVYLLGGVVNPNGLEIAGVAAFVPLLWLVFSSRDAPRTAIVAMAVIAAIVANLRATSPLYLLVAAIVVATAVGWPRAGEFVRRKDVLVVVIPALAVALLGAAWTLLIGMQAGFIPSWGTDRPGPVAAFLYTIGNSVAYGRELVGVFGWLDTVLPEWVYASWAAVAGMVLLVAVSLTRGRRLLAVTLSIAALILLPAVIQAPSAADYGYIWQGRYSLPLYAAASIIAGLSLAHTFDGHSVRPARRIFVVLVISVTLMQAVGFFVTLRRYVVGVDDGYVGMITAPEWMPPGTWFTPMLLFIIGAIGVGAALVLPGSTPSPSHNPSVPAKRPTAAGTSDASFASPRRTANH
jgi:hypothetical protein